ncbi:LOW QUALITY PROTEIN: protein kintoun [Limanda limanda]|uniref:LOW QUALITY PROTEIN: protein kintoun n=1 Tax=Limanda limanda TaxID=27771 RepID=UPI0029C8A39A|nr:LOW QUALITY PROTEIN: protein kintoun [Limanda limanda]
MEPGKNLEDLNITADEVDRLRKALKDEKFREMLQDYAEEISNPENKRRYEEEIALLERERGNNIDFIHPEPFKALKTSVDGSRKCFINICSNEKVGKPECKIVSEDGRRGQSWSVPHSLHPGRQDTDSKGNQITIYDVIFHPDTLHIASKDKRFMDIVDSTAIQGIEKAFKVTLDKNNMRLLKTKYKGTPQPCVIRKPIPGFKDEGPSVEPDPLAFPFPGDKGPAPSSQTKPQNPASQSKEPTQPKYTVKYRHFVDVQDFRNSRDSAQSPRPKEIVVTIDLPLLRSVADTSLEVMKQRLLLESENPAYRLELPLAYPVDEDKGEAKFNKHRGQLTVTLLVLPSNEVFDYASWPAVTDADGQGEGVDERNVSESEEERGKEQERESEKGDEEQRCVEEEEGKGSKAGKSREEDKKQQTKGGGEDEDREEQMRGDQGGVEGDERSEVGEEEEQRPHKREGEESEDEGSGVEREAKCKKQNGKEESVEEERGKEQERGIEKVEEEQSCVEEEEVKQERVDEEDKKQQTKGGGEDEDREEQMRGDQGGVEGEERSEVGEEEERRPHKREGEESEDEGSGVEREAKCKKQNGKEESVEEERGKEQERGIEKGEEEQRCVEEEEEVKQEKVYEEDKKQQTKGGGEDEDREEQMRGDQGGVEGEERSEVGEEEERRPHKREGKESEDEGSGVEREANCKKQNGKEESVEEERGEEDKAEEQKQENVNEDKLTAEHSREEEEVNLTLEIQEETEKMEENLQENAQVEADVEFHSHTSGEELSAMTTTSGLDVVEDVSQGTKVSETEAAKEPGRGGSGEQSERDNLDQDDLDQDDLDTEQIFQTPVHNEQHALLREIDEDGKENVHSDHSTSAGFILHNALMYELD